MKFKAKAKDCQLSVKVKASFGEVIDDRELDRFRRVFLRGFLKPKMIKRNLVAYTGPVCISFYDRFKKPMTKREFLFVLEQLSVAVQKLRVNHFSINGLVMDIFKYTSIKEIFNEIAGKSADVLKIDKASKRETQVILFYSASGGVGKTTVAMGVAASLTKNYKRVLYINAVIYFVYGNIISPV